MGAEELKTVQVLMEIDSEDYQNLKASIEKDGKIREPLKGYRDKQGNLFLLSGWNRLKIAKELGWKTVPFTEVEGLDTKEQREAFAISENLARRQLGTNQKQNLIAYYLKLNPELSNRAIADKTGVDKNTVKKKREELEGTGEIHQLGKTVGKDGKERTTKPKLEGTGEIPQLKTQPTKASSKAPKPQDPKDRIKELKLEKKELETRLKAIDKELTKLGVKV